jgi:hypothetical protein
MYISNSKQTAIKEEHDTESHEEHAEGSQCSPDLWPAVSMRSERYLSSILAAGAIKSSFHAHTLPIGEPDHPRRSIQSSSKSIASQTPSLSMFQSRVLAKFENETRDGSSS